MMAKVVAIPKADVESHAAIPHAPPEALSARRAELMAETGKLNRVAQAREAAERALAELDAAQSSLDESEKEAWREWALNDAEGPPPSPRTQERAQGLVEYGLIIARFSRAI